MAAVEEDADTGAPAPKVVHCTSTWSASDSEVASAKSRVSWSACLPRSNSDSQIAFITGGIDRDGYRDPGAAADVLVAADQHLQHDAV